MYTNRNESYILFSVAKGYKNEGHTTVIKICSYGEPRSSLSDLSLILSKLLCKSPFQEDETKFQHQQQSDVVPKSSDSQDNLSIYPSYWDKTSQQTQNRITKETSYCSPSSYYTKNSNNWNCSPNNWNRFYNNWNYPPGNLNSNQNYWNCFPGNYYNLNCSPWNSNSCNCSEWNQTSGFGNSLKCFSGCDTETGFWTYCPYCGRWSYQSFVNPWHNSLNNFPTFSNIDPQNNSFNSSLPLSEETNPYFTAL